ALTRTRGASSSASERVIASSAALAMQYTAWPARGRSAYRSTRLTMAPRLCCRWGAAAWARKNGARALLASRVSQSAGVVSPTGVGKNADALFTSASSRPKWPTVPATSPGRRSNSARSACSTSALPGRACSSSPASASASRRESRQWIVTLKPSACRRRTTAAPSRRALPVTRATGAVPLGGVGMGIDAGVKDEWLSCATAQQDANVTASKLPDPAPEALAHSARLQELLREQIGEAGGSVPFSRFMELALYAPGLGYYSAGASKFGAEGDFITAPGLGPVFAACVAEAIAPVLQQIGPQARLLELGGGTGAFAEVALKRLLELDALPDRYCILEPSAQ